MKSYVALGAVTMAGIIAVVVIWPYDGGIGPAALVAFIGLCMAWFLD
jgi:hypothetical protein